MYENALKERAYSAAPIAFTARISYDVGGEAVSAEPENVPTERWSREFTLYGELWGNNPSPSGDYLTKNVEELADRMKQAATMLKAGHISLEDVKSSFGYATDLSLKDTLDE